MCQSSVSKFVHQSYFYIGQSVWCCKILIWEWIQEAILQNKTAHLSRRHDRLAFFWGALNKNFVLHWLQRLWRCPRRYLRVSRRSGRSRTRSRFLPQLRINKRSPMQRSRQRNPSPTAAQNPLTTKRWRKLSKLWVYFCILYMCWFPSFPQWQLCVGGYLNSINRVSTKWSLSVYVGGYIALPFFSSSM